MSRMRAGGFFTKSLIATPHKIKIKLQTGKFSFNLTIKSHPCDETEGSLTAPRGAFLLGSFSLSLFQCILFPLTNALQLPFHSFYYTKREFTKISASTSTSLAMEEPEALAKSSWSGWEWKFHTDCTEIKIESQSLELWIINTFTLCWHILPLGLVMGLSHFGNFFRRLPATVIVVPGHRKTGDWIPWRQCQQPTT